MHIRQHGVDNKCPVIPGLGKAVSATSRTGRRLLSALYASCGQKAEPR
jgi:hypothetical protein